MTRSSRLRTAVAGGSALSLLLVGCGGNDATESGESTAESAEDEATEPADGQTPPADLPELTEVTVGYMSTVDQMGAAVAQDIGFYDEQSLSATLAEPFPTGDDALDALEAGDIDFVQVGMASIDAILQGMDLTYLGSYTGSSVQLGIDETLAMVAAADSGIEGDDLSTLAGKTVGVSLESISHRYLLGILNELGMEEGEVQIVETPPQDMGDDLETGRLDAAVVRDPWPITIANSVEGAYEVTRGGGRTAFIGYLIALRDYVESNPGTVEAFLTARAAADQWMRQNPGEASDVVVRWIAETEPEVAQEAMQYNIEQLDPRLSACNYLALDTTMDLLLEQGAIESTYDVNDHFAPEHILNVMDQRPELFDDLPPIPESAQIGPDYVFDRAEAEQACPAN